MTTQWPVTLKITRNLAPADRWHWSVSFHGGHLWIVSASFPSAEACIADAAVAGLDALRRAEAALARPAPAAAIPS